MFADIQFVTILAIIMPLFLILDIPVFSLKFDKQESINSKVNLLRITLIIISIIFFFVFKFAAFPFIVILYLILSLINNLYKL